MISSPFLLLFLFALFYNEMVTVDKYIETERVALLQTCSRVWNDQLCPNTEHAFLSICYCHVIIFLYIFFRRVFSFYKALKSTICHAENAQITSLWNAMSNTATERSSCTLS